MKLGRLYVHVQLFGRRFHWPRSGWGVSVNLDGSPLPSIFETGLPLTVPETGLYRLHKGERIVPRNKNAPPEDS